MEFRICGKRFRFKELKVEYYYKNEWRKIGAAKTLEDAIEYAKYYALCTLS